MDSARALSGFSTNRLTLRAPLSVSSPGWMYPNPGSPRVGTTPTVTSACSSIATRSAATSALRNPASSAIAQSACTQIIVESAPERLSISLAAHARAAAVPAGFGSAMMFSRGTAGAAAAIASASEALVRMRVCSPGTIFSSLSSVFTRRGLSVTSGRSCFGRRGVESGQKREPTPPARITAHLVIVFRGFVGRDAGELCDQRVEFLRAERFREKSRCAILPRFPLVLFLARGSQDDAWHVLHSLVSADFLEHVEPAHARHHHIEHNRVHAI